jgi:hypothetical protein
MLISEPRLLRPMTVEPIMGDRENILLTEMEEIHHESETENED